MYVFFGKSALNTHTNLEITRYALDALNIDRHGLNEMDNRILRTISNLFSNNFPYFRIHEIRMTDKSQIGKMSAVHCCFAVRTDMS